MGLFLLKNVVLGLKWVKLLTIVNKIVKKWSKVVDIVFINIYNQIITDEGGR